MKRLLCAIGCLCLGTALAGTKADLGLDRGGFTFDFAKISGKSMQSSGKTEEINLFSNPDFRQEDNSKNILNWRSTYCFVHSKEAAKGDNEKARKHVKYEVKDGVASVIKPESLLSDLPEKLVKCTSGGWTKGVNFPDDKGGAYRLSFKYKSSHAANYSGAMVLGYYNTEVLGKHYKGKNLPLKYFKLSDTPGQWQTYSEEFTIPAGAKSGDFTFRIDGIGRLDFKEPKLVRLNATNPIQLQLSHHGALDNTFALSQGQGGIMTFQWKLNVPKTELNVKKPRLILTLPNEITFHEAPELKVLETRKLKDCTEYHVDMQGRFRSINNEFNTYLVTPALISTNAAPGFRKRATARIENEGMTLSNIEHIDFFVIPAIKGGKAKHHHMGIYLGGRYLNMTEKGYEAALPLWKDAGVRWVVGGSPKNFDKFRSIGGVDVITPELYFIANGFRIGPPEGRPEEDKYRYLGTPSNKKELDRATCPIAVYEKRPFFMESTVKYINESIKGSDGIWANWEPYGYAGRGCFCDNCRDKFAEYAGISKEEVKKIWPHELAVGKKYYEKAVRFRSLEHAKLVRTIDEVVTKATGGEKSKGFIPGVAYVTMYEKAAKHGYDKETHPSDYAADMKWIDPWGPYPWWSVDTSLLYDKMFNLRTFVAAKDVRATVNRQYPEGKRPKLLSFPHGVQGRHITQPESIEIDLLSFLFNQYEASTIYSFPKGYDGRYWAAFARATVIAAKFDGFVTEGKRIDGDVTLTPVQPYALSTTYTDSQLGETMEYDMLQHTAYKLDGKVIVSAFNFWQKGEAFFKLQVKGLSRWKKYTVSANGKLFTSGKGDVFTAKELAKGVTLHAGAMRCVVYEISPAAKNQEWTMKITPEMLADFRKANLPAMEKAAAEDKKYEEMYRPKKSTLKDMSNAGIDCKADLENSTLTFTSQDGKVMFYSPSMSIFQWTYGGNKLISLSDKNNGIAAAFWSPSFQIRAGSVVTEQKSIPGGLEIRCERGFLDKDNPDLQGMVMEQTFQITDNCRKIVVKTTLRNDTERTISQGFRYNVMPLPPAGGDGATVIRADGKESLFKRNLGRSIFAADKDDFFLDNIRKLYEVKEDTRIIDLPFAIFKNGKVAMQMDVAPAEAFAGVAVWDSGNQPAGTFEPCFKFQPIPPIGGKLGYQLTLQIK